MMSNNWSTVDIGSICAGIFDGPHATPRKTDSGPVFLGISSLEAGRINLHGVEHLSEEDFAKWTRRVTPQEGDVVFSYETRLGEVALIPRGLRCCLGRRMALMRPDTTKVEPRFLLYAYMGQEFQDTLRKHTIHGSTVDRIPLTEFPRFPIRIPPLPEQRAIAAILGALDDKIELNRRMNRTLESMARAIFTSWFVDFDPVRAKMEGRLPFGMDADTAALFPDAFEDSPVGQIPQGWRIAPIGDLVRVVGGGTPSTKEASFWQEGTIPWATPKDLSALTTMVLPDTERKITQAGLKHVSSGLLPEGTVLLSSRAPIGYLAISVVPVAINQGFIAMVCDGPLSNHYVLQWAQANMDTIKGRANGTTFQEISKVNFRPIPAVVPDQLVLQKFTLYIDQLHRKVMSNLQQSLTLSSIRDALLPKLLSGDVRAGNEQLP
jgi:type I restriction enzyme S subunit